MPHTCTDCFDVSFIIFVINRLSDLEFIQVNLRDLNNFFERNMQVSNSSFEEIGNCQLKTVRQTFNLRV